MRDQANRGLTRRHFLRAAVGVAGVGVLAACQPKVVEKVVTKVVKEVVEKEVTAVPAPVEVETVNVYECCWAEVHIKAGGGLYRQFEVAHPNIKVDDFWPFGDPGWMESLLAKTAADEPIDVIWWCASHHKFAEEGRLLDLQPLVDADTSGFTLDAFQATGVDFCYDLPDRQGALWAAPTNYATVLLWYNMDMFDAAGVDYPTNDWTWDDALEAAKAITRDTDGDGIPNEWGIRVGRDSWRCEPVVRSFGGGYVEVDGAGCLINSAESVAGLEFLQDLMIKHKVAPSAGDEAAMGSTAMFNSNKLAMLVNPEWGLREHLPAHESEGLNFGVALLPKGPAKRSTNYWAGVTSLTSHAKGSAAAWEVLKFIVSDQYQRTMTVFIPESPAARIETAMYGWLDYHTYPDDRSALVESPKYGQQYFRIARYGKELEDIIGPALDPVWLGEATPGEVVADICTKVDAKIKELRS